MHDNWINNKMQFKLGYVYISMPHNPKFLMSTNMLPKNMLNY